MVFFHLVLVGCLFAVIAWYVFGRMPKSGEELTQESLDEEQTRQLRLAATKAENRKEASRNGLKDQQKGNPPCSFVALTEDSGTGYTHL